MMLLNIQYRMHRDIASFPSLQFYNGKLLNAENNSDLHRQSRGPNPLLVSDRVAGKDFFWKPYHDDTTGRFRPLVLHDVYSGFERRVGTSYSNEVEVQKQS